MQEKGVRLDLSRIFGVPLGLPALGGGAGGGGSGGFWILSGEFWKGLKVDPCPILKTRICTKPFSST